MILNQSNYTDEAVEWSPGLQTTACLLYSFILLVGITGNILVIVIVLRYRDMRNATNLLLTNLSIADLFLLLFCTSEGFQHLYGKDKHLFGKFMCSFSPFVQNATSTCSVLTIMAISYERYVAICKPLQTSSVRLTLFRTLPTVIFFWCLSCFISIPFYKYSKIELAVSIYNETIPTCVTIFPLEWADGYLISCTLCLYLMIFLMLCYWHFSICYILFNRETLLRDNTILTRYRRQVAQLLITLIISFFILILPHKIWAYIQQQLTRDELYQIGFDRHSFIIISTRALLYLNSAINPLLYAIMSTKFRQSCILLCGECRRSKKNQRSHVVFFHKAYNVRPVLGVNGLGGTISTTGKISFNQPQEKKSLLADNTPITGNPIDDPKFIFPECYLGIS